MEEQKIKQDAIHIGENIREIRKAKGIGQTQLVQMVQLEGGAMTRETLGKLSVAYSICTHHNCVLFEMH